MATDYKKINEKSRINLRSIRDQRGDKTHFVYELVQNADDSKSKRLELHLCEKELLVWNDGCKFREEDVLRISSIGFSDKDLTQIGNFGTGFKAVYNYTDRPEVYSGDERFCLPDPTSISKTLEDLASSSLVEGIDKVPPKIAELVEEGKTVFRLPFKENLREEDLMLLKDQLRELLKKRPLLFLPHLETIQWYDICSGQAGTYCRYPHGKIQNANQVELKSSMNGEVQESERFLVFSKKFQPRPDIIDELLQIEYEPERRKRIQETAGKLQPIEVAFKLQDGKIIAMDNCVLFAYLSTQKETHLRFFIQARYQTNPARNDIEKTDQNLWNRWLVEETAKFLPDLLEELKEAGLLKPAFFNVLPLKGKVENDFKPIAKALRKAMREKLLVPTEDDGYARAENVFYPHHGSLRKLVECSWIYPNSSWLHQDIGRSGYTFNVMKEAGVKEIDVSQVLNWLEKQDFRWFEDRSEKWLRELYVYLSSQKSGLERIKKLPLVRLENGRHVCASEAFFPPETDEEHEEIAPFLNELPILQSALLEAEDHNDVKPFLRDLGVEYLHPENLINKSIFPLYRKSDKPCGMENRWHVRYIFKVWDKLLGYQHRNLREKISETPILRAYNGGQPESFDFVKPCDAYLPEAYTGDTDLETYFSVYNGDVWFVDRAYLEDNSDSKEWFKFLKAIGAMDTPCIIEKTIAAKSEIDPEFDRELDKRNIKGQWKRSTWWQQTNIKDFYLLGLSEILAEISEHKRIDLSQVCWCLLVKVLPSGPKARDAFFQGTYHRFYYSNRSDPFDATFYRQLKETAWLPDEQGNLHRPSECFAPTSENRSVLGDSVAYLHPDFDVSQDNGSAQGLAGKLEIYLTAKTENVMNYLQTLSNTKVSMEKVEPLYRFLDRQNARRGEEFKKNPLIFTPNPESRWWRVDEVFWEDKSEVLESDPRCLKAHYPASLRSFFINLGVSEQASQRDYALRIQEIAATEQAENEKVRERLQRLYKCLITWRKDEWEIIYDDRCWLGRKGEKWGFFTRQELVLKNHPHIGELFEGEIPFWEFDGDLSSLAWNLKVEGCSQAEVEFHPDGDQEEDTDWSEKVRKLRPYIYAFLNSPRLCEELQREKFAKFSTNCSVRQVKELRVTYEFKRTSVSDPNPRLSSLDVTNQPAKLWLGLKESEDDYAELIGDALQDYFGAKELGRFIEDLLTPTKKQDRVLSNWKRKGLETKFLNEDPEDDEKFADEPNRGDADSAADESDMKIPTDNETPKTEDEDNDSLTNKADESETHLSSSRGNDSRTDKPEIEIPVDSEITEIDESDDDSTMDESESPTNSASDIRNINSPDTQPSTKTGSGTTQNANEESESETPTVHENPETANENGYSTENKSDTASYQPRPGGSKTRSRGGKAINTPNGNQGMGHSSRHSSGKEDNTHMGATDTSSHDRKEVEHAGMKRACRHEKKEGRNPKDVSLESHGYDIYSTSPDGKNRCIEVKARDGHGFVGLTSKEWSVAKQLKDNYFLYVVLNARTQPELYIIQNPADVVRTEEQIDVRYQVPLSEIKEHGKLV